MSNNRADVVPFSGEMHCFIIFLCSISILQSKNFNVTSNGRLAGLTLDWNMGFALYDNASRQFAWQYKFSQLRGSSDDGKSKLKLHFQDVETKGIETKVNFPLKAFVDIYS